MSTAEAPAPTSARTDARADGGTRRWPVAAAWMVLAVVTVAGLAVTLAWDFRDEPLVGDQASHLMQAMSLAHDADLRFDADDLQRWRDMGWTAEPLGLFFQASDDGWSFAKPYGYSLWLAPFVKAFGAVSGVAVGNAALLLAVVAVSVALVARASNAGLRSPAPPLLAASLVFGSHLWLSAVTVHTELLLAALVGVLFLLVDHWHAGSIAAAAGTGVVTGFLLTDKPVFAVLIAPAALWLVVRAAKDRRWWEVVAPAAALLGAFAVATLPYLVASDGAAPTPYGGERYYAKTSTPFDPAEANPERSSTSGEARDIPRDWGRIESHDASSPLRLALDALTSPLEPLRSAAFTVVGRHTGLVVFDPFALAALVGAVVAWRRLDGVARATAAGIVAYLAFYVVVFPDNYYGGSQSIGNRYFAQVVPAVALLAGGLVARSRRDAQRWAVAAVVLGVASVAVTWPLHSRPTEAFNHPARTTSVQRLLPVETTQDPIVNVLCTQPDAHC